MSAATPSQFAQLFKRSKFATFDPQIAQIYTTHGGYAHRGEFGLKRRLPASARKQQNYVVVKAVDSSVMQTEWSTAQNQARWIKRFDELGVKADYSSDASWGLRGKVLQKWDMVSSFDPRNNVPHAPRASAAMAPNWDAMNEAEFNKYLEHLRQNRPKFLRYLNKSREFEQPSVPSVPFQDLINNVMDCRQRDRKHFAFLQSEADQRLSSNQITPSPHPNAALSYTSSSKLQNSSLYPAAPSRYIPLQRTGIYDTGIDEARKAFAIGGTLANDTSGGRMPVLRLDRVAVNETLPEATSLDVRVTRVQVADAPNVVGPHNGLGGAKIYMDAKREIAAESTEGINARLNPHKMGSAEYVSWSAQKVQAREATSYRTPWDRNPPEKMTPRAANRVFHDTMGSLKKAYGSKTRKVPGETYAKSSPRSKAP